MESPHVPVLYKETIEYFKNIKEGYIIDCTTGFAGHSLGILEANKNIKLICNDQDDYALEFAKKRLEKYKDRVIFHKGNFEHVIEEFKDYEIKGILADIGVSSFQLDEPKRGFSFDSKILDMRMDQKQTLDASTVVNSYSQHDLEKIFKEYGEVREYKKVASIIVKNRPFSSSKEIAELLSKKMSKGKIHPATLPFQAIRIEVNDELGVLKRFLKSLAKTRFKNCVVAVISFHSLEDRLVKHYFKNWTKNCICPPEVFRCECGNNHSLGKVLTKKPIVPTLEEIKKNPRSRSSKLRVFKFD